MSQIKILNKRGSRIEPCGTLDKISSQELTRSLLQFFAYGLINNPKVNSRKMYQGQNYAVFQLNNHGKDNQIFLTDLLAMLQMLCFCQWHLSKTQASLIS